MNHYLINGGINIVCTLCIVTTSWKEKSFLLTLNEQLVYDLMGEPSYWNDNYCYEDQCYDIDEIFSEANFTDKAPLQKYFV